MKTGYLKTIILFLFITITTSVSAEGIQNPAAPPMNHGMGMRHGMSGMMGNMTEEQKDQHLKTMQEHLLNMHDLSNQILSEKDPAKKEQLKKQQLALMKAHHETMRESHKPMMEPPTK